MKNISRLVMLLALTVCLITGMTVIEGCAAKSPTTAASFFPSSKTITGTGAPSVNSTAPSGISSKTSQSVKITDTGNILKFKTVSFVDKQGIGIEAFKVLVPTDWQYEGGVDWVMDSPTMPAISRFRIWNPAGTEQFQVFPNQGFFWTDNSLTAQLFPAGSKYFGSEVKEPVSALNALKQIVIPRFRSNVYNLRFVTEQDITNIINSSQNSKPTAVPTSTEAAKVRAEYVENGKTIEDELFCVVEASYIPLQTIYGPRTNIMWGVNYIASYKAEKGKLNNSAKILKTISDSVTLNLKWFNTYVQVVEYLIKMNIQQIQSIGQLGSIIAQTGREIREENLNLYQQREAVNERISSQFSEYVRGVDSYYNPLEQKNIELPSGYDNVWVDNSGNYVLTDNPNYNPNIGNNQNFQKLEKAK